MKKLIGVACLVLCLSGCYTYKPLLESSEYQILDTLHVSYGGNGQVYGYDVIIKYNDNFHHAYLDNNGDLIHLSIKKIDLDQK